jgi:hypothetical protein
VARELDCPAGLGRAPGARRRTFVVTEGETVLASHALSFVAVPSRFADLAAGDGTFLRRSKASAGGTRDHVARASALAYYRPGGSGRCQFLRRPHTALRRAHPGAASIALISAGRSD